jgi:toxin CcdB
MPQFAVHKNLNRETKRAVPYLLDVQSDLLSELGTRVVMPLYPAAAMKGKTFKTLTPIFEINGRSFAAITPQLAGISKKALGPAVADLSAHRAEIVAALDVLITGI